MLRIELDRDVEGGARGVDRRAGVVGGAVIRAKNQVETLLRMGGGGLLVGAALGGAFTVVTRQIEDHLIETTLSVLLADGSFLVAEQLHCSGVLSTVFAGIIAGAYGTRWGMSALARDAVPFSIVARAAHERVLPLAADHASPRLGEGVLVAHPLDGVVADSLRARLSPGPLPRGGYANTLNATGNSASKSATIHLTKSQVIKMQIMLGVNVGIHLKYKVSLAGPLNLQAYPTRLATRESNLQLASDRKSVV